MRGISMALFAGLCFSVVACSGASSDEGGAAADPGAPPPAGEEQAPEAIAPLSPEEIPLDADAGAAAPQEAPAADAGSDAAAPKQVIPMPGTGKLHATTNTGDACAWTVNSVAKGTSTALDLTLYVGWYVLSCKRADGVSTSATVNIAQGLTTNQVMAFPLPPGKLVAVAVGGSCTWSVNGAAKGTSTDLTITLAPATYTVACKPSDGTATKSRSVIIKSGETAMAMFKLS